MISSKRVFIFFVSILIFIRVGAAIAQAPAISYITPQNYTVNTGISPLAPKNTGGAVPAGGYAQVITLAGAGNPYVLNLSAPNEGYFSPAAITVDDKGNLYLADTFNNQVRKITPGGVVSVFAGSGLQGHSDGQGMAASFNLPRGITIDPAGNLYIGDSGNDLVRKITPAGLVSTTAGSGIAGFDNGPGSSATFDQPTGIALDKAGNIYVVDLNNNAIRKITPSGIVSTFAGNKAAGFADGQGIAASFNGPWGMAIDKGDNLYVADYYNNCIRKITPAALVSTLAGNKTAGSADGLGANAGFFYPVGVSADASGNIFVGDALNNLIRKITPDGNVTTIAGNVIAGSMDGPVKNATFNIPEGLAVDAAGNIYICDANNFLVRKIAVSGYTIDKPLPPGLIFDPTTGIISGTPTATSPATDYTVTAYNASGSSSTIVNIAVTGANPAVLPPDISYKTPQTYTVNTSISPLAPKNTGGAVPATIYGQVTTFAGSGAFGTADGNAASASFHYPTGVATDASGNVYVADYQNNSIRKITPAGVVSTLAGSGAAGKADGAGANASFYEPNSLVLDAAGNVYVVDLGNDLIRKITPSGVVTTLAGSGAEGAIDGPGTGASFYNPTGITIDASGNIFVADKNNNMIRKIAADGTVSSFAGTTTRGFADGTGASASFYDPQNIVADKSGNLFVTDYVNQAIREITPAGVVSTLAGNGTTGSQNGTGKAATFNFPSGITVDPLGNVYVAGFGDNIIRKITPAGVVTTFAGNGSPAHVDGIGTAASFSGLNGLAIDISGNIYVADTYSDVIRKIITTGYIIDKPLPAGLTFDSATGSITGTPTAASPATNYTVTAYNGGGSSSTIVNITVTANSIPLIPPPVISYQTPQVYTVSTTISPLAPKNTGGAVPATIYGQVTTFAGSGTVGKADGTGLSASFYSPFSLATDAQNNIYVADESNDNIRKVTPGAVVSTIAGGGQVLSIDGTGAAAGFDVPTGISLDPLGTIYVADAASNVIRMVSQGGLVTTYAGTFGQGFDNGPRNTATFKNASGTATDASGNIFIADFGNNVIRKIDAAGNVTTFAGSGAASSTDGAGLLATFNAPRALAMDNAGNLYVAEFSNIIRKITPAGVVSTLAGNGSSGSVDGTGTAASFNTPTGLAIDASGNIFVADEGNTLIRKITQAGVVTTFAGSGQGGAADGVGTAASFEGPAGIATDHLGNLYIGDFGNFNIRKILLTGYTIDKALPPGLTFDPKTGVISGTPTAASPATNYTVTAYNAGGSSSTVVNISVKSPLNSLPLPPNINYQTPQVYHVNTAISPLPPTNTGGAVPPEVYGQVTTFAGSGSAGNINGTGTGASFNDPAAVAFDKAGNLFVSESANNDVRKITPAGVVSAFAGTGASGTNNGAGSTATFNSPYQITIDAAGNIYTADEANMMIRKVTPADVVSVFAGNGGQGSDNGAASASTFNNPSGTAVDAAGNVYVVDRGDSRIRKIDITGQVTTLGILDGGATPPNFATGLEYIAVDAAGNLYFTDGNQVEVMTPAGAINVIAGTTGAGFVNGPAIAAKFNRLVGVAVDALGNIFVADAGNNLIRKISTAGMVTTLAGEGGNGSNNGTGASASFNAPYGLAVDNTGDYLYVADRTNHLIRKIAITGYFIDKSLPSGLVFDAQTGMVSGTPAVPSPPETYTITAFNAGGSSTTTLSIEIDEATIVFGPIASKTVCDNDFDPGATSTDPITYTSSNTGVATVVAGKVHITGPGTAVINASDGTTSVPQNLTVIAAVTPTITISPAAQDNCQDSLVTYTTTIANGGTNPVYQWQVNGVNTGTNSAQFSSSSLNNADQVTCTLTSNATCITGATAVSNTATFTIDPPVTTSLSITSSAPGPVCPGTPVTFVASPVTPDNTPTYQWLVNGKNTGAGSPVFVSSSLRNGDIVTCNMISVGKCLVNPDTVSNAVTVNISPVDVCTIVIPNTFTPNGDGINDHWDITALVSYPYCSVNIYTRYGTLIYSTIGYPKPWDGTYNGKPLPVGTYYYIIDPKNGMKKLAGFVTILR